MVAESHGRSAVTVVCPRPHSRNGMREQARECVRCREVGVSSKNWVVRSAVLEGSWLCVCVCVAGRWGFSKDCVVRSAVLEDSWLCVCVAESWCVTKDFVVRSAVLRGSWLCARCGEVGVAKLFGQQCRRAPRPPERPHCCRPESPARVPPGCECFPALFQCKSVYNIKEKE